MRPGAMVNPKPDLKKRETAANATFELGRGGRATYGGVCQCGWYPDEVHENQDAMCLVPALGGYNEQLFLGVFDGHGKGGEKVAYAAKDAVPKYVAEFREKGTLPTFGPAGAPMPPAGTSAYEKAFTHTNAEVTRKLRQAANFAGSTAVTAFFVTDAVHVANVGDSRAIMGTDQGAGKPWAVYELTKDQTVFREDERARIREEAAAPVQFATLGMMYGEEPFSEDFGTESIELAADPPRVFIQGQPCPGTAFTRSIGDVVGKSVGICARPEMHSCALTSEHKCVVLCSDGVFEFMPNEEVLEVAQRHMPDATSAAKELVETSFQRWVDADEGRTDDITAIVVYLDGFKDLATAVKQPGARGWAMLRERTLPNVVNRPARVFAETVLEMLKKMKRYDRDLAVQELFPEFDWADLSRLSVKPDHDPPGEE